MLDKTGTITLGNRMAFEFIAADGVDIEQLAKAAQLSSLADETPEGRSIVALCKNKYAINTPDLSQYKHEFIPFTAQTRMSGVILDNKEIFKGAVDAIEDYLKENGAIFSEDIKQITVNIARNGGTPLVVTSDKKALGVIYLKDIVKGGIKEKFNELRRMGIKTVMITGDNPLTAASIAAESGCG